jgi:hypothetical protein
VRACACVCVHPKRRASQERHCPQRTAQKREPAAQPTVYGCRSRADMAARPDRLGGAGGPAPVLRRAQEAALMASSELSLQGGACATKGRQARLPEQNPT